MDLFVFVASMHINVFEGWENAHVFMNTPYKSTFVKSLYHWAL